MWKAVRNNVWPIPPANIVGVVGRFAALGRATAAAVYHIGGCVAVVRFGMHSSSGQVLLLLCFLPGTTQLQNGGSQPRNGVSQHHRFLES